MGALIGRRLAIATALALLGAAAVPAIGRWWEARAIAARLAAVGNGTGASCAAALPIAQATPVLASWQSVGGCGAGASSGTGGAVKWIGRNVTGGLFHVECLANYVKLPYGYDYLATTRLTTSLGPRWNAGISVPYLYKYTYDPYSMYTDVSNQGLGDINALVTRRFGQIADWSATLSIGAPTGTHDAKFRTQLLKQERQLGHGRPTASLMLDHTRDTDWGLTVLGGNLNWRGGENAINNYRAPSASLYGFAGYVLGPLTPAAGLSVTGYAAHDRNAGADQGTPRVSVAANVSLEWATDWVAILLGATLPYDYVGRARDFHGAGGFGAWAVALGIAVSPF